VFFYRLLYQQRIFTFVPQLTKELADISDPTQKTNYLLALIQICSLVPQSYLAMEKTSISRVITLAINSDDFSLHEPALTVRF